MKKVKMMIAVGVFMFGITLNATTVDTVAQSTTTSEANIPSETSTESITYDSMGLPLAGVSAVLVGNLESTDSDADITVKTTNTVATSEYELSEEEIEKAEVEKIEQKKWDARYEEYPEASYIWQYLEDKGYNEYVIAGIMGNLMVEVGGYTLDLDVTNSHGHYYGMCQWNTGLYPGAMNRDLTGQLEYLTDVTIQQEFETFGYVSGYTYEEFLAIQDEQSAAKAFAQTYERCGNGTVYLRQECATAALEYFTE